jgi:hypothetical protein
MIRLSDLIGEIRLWRKNKRRLLSGLTVFYIVLPMTVFFLERLNTSTKNSGSYASGLLVGFLLAFRSATDLPLPRFVRECSQGRFALNQEPDAERP